MPSKISILLGDGVSRGLEGVLSQSFRLLGTVGDGQALIAAALVLKPDVVITDIFMPGLAEMEAIRQIKKARPATKIVALSRHSEAALVEGALNAGATGYVLKISALENLVNAIREVVMGRIYICSRVAGLVAALHQTPAAPSGERRLTARQLEVLRLIGEGCTMKKVASMLGISRRTAESHKYYMMQALGCKTTAELVRHAVKLRLVP